LSRLSTALVTGANFSGGGGVKGVKMWLKVWMTPPSNDSREQDVGTDRITLALIDELARLQAETEKLSRKLAKLTIKRQALEAERARLKRLPPRPPHKDG
jgi:uncharacterized coiled-coil protein SlyX